MPSFTEKAITDTFIKLLNQKPLDKITVKDLVDECGINRSTFYYYFEDIYALLEHVLVEETEIAIENYRDYNNWLEGFYHAASFAVDNKKAIYHIYNSVSREMLEKYLYRVVENVIKVAIKSQIGTLSVSEYDKDLIIEVYKSMLVGLILNWLESGMKTDANKKLARLGVLLEGDIHSMLKKAAENK